MSIYLKRVYEQPSKKDGFRVLVDRLWPRGVSREKANVDAWIKDVGPSSHLRQWFQHDPKKFSSFKQAYLEELKHGQQRLAFEQLKRIVQEEDVVTFIFASKETTYNHVVILKEIIQHDIL